MYDFYDVPLSDATLKRSRKSLKNLYQSIPETEGCLSNIAKEGGCGAWCCEVQSPSVFYCEFLNTWNTVKSSWGKERLIKLIMACVRNYLTSNATKGCVFWDTTSKQCQQHMTRPFNCRTYGQIPDEEFKPRYERLKVLYENDPTAAIHPQCNLVKSIGEPPSVEEMQRWFSELQLLETDVGVEKNAIHDEKGGSYRTYHDHILLKIGSPALLEKLTIIRQMGDVASKSAFINLLEEQLISGVMKI